MAEDKSFNWFPVGPVEEVKSQKCRRLYADSGNDLALFYLRKDNEDRFFASSASCPHAKGPIDQGDIEDLGSSVLVTCPMHLYTFDLVTGVNISGLKLPVYDTEIREGQLYVKAAEKLYLKSAAKRAKEKGFADQCSDNKGCAD